MEVGLFFFNVENGGHQIMRAKKNVFKSQLFNVVGITFPISPTHMPMRVL